jgi:hypothetical protein
MPSLNRRGFLGLVGGAVATSVLDPERALWMPGAKLISIPRALFVGPQYRSGLITLEYLSRIRREMLRRNVGVLRFHQRAYSIVFDEQDALPNIGDTVNVRLLKRFDVALGYGRFR